MTDEDAAFAELVDSFAGDPRVTLPAAQQGRFGSKGLRVDGKVFAMRVAGKLAVKLTKAEVDAAIARGQGHALEMGEGRIMKAWLVVHDPATWATHAMRARELALGRTK